MRSGVIFLVFSMLVAVAIAEDSKLQVLQSNSKFTKDLYKILSKNEGNVFFSPISAHTALSMAYLGSDGSTQRAFQTSLGLPDPDTTAEGYQTISSKLNNVPNVTLLIANKIYIKNNYNLQENYKTAVVNKFNSEIQSVDFDNNVGAANTINEWVEGKTNKKIKNLIESSDIDELTRLILVNAIYFKGNWKDKFNKDYTRTEPFYLNAKDKIDVQMMHINKEFNFKNDKTLNAKILELPYTNPDVSLVIILPDEKDGIKDLEAKLADVDLTKITDGAWESDVELALPKFKIEITMQLKESLTEIGLGEIFSNGANFSKMIKENENLKVSKVVQKAFIEVNEEGAEAAAATGVVVAVPVSLPMYQYFLVDHPFIFLLKSESTILFVGKCEHPVSGDNNRAPVGEPIKDPFSRHINIKLEN